MSFSGVSLRVAVCCSTASHRPDATSATKPSMLSTVLSATSVSSCSADRERPRPCSFRNCITRRTTSADSTSIAEAMLAGGRSASEGGPRADRPRRECPTRRWLLGLASTATRLAEPCSSNKRRLCFAELFGGIGDRRQSSSNCPRPDSWPQNGTSPRARPAMEAHLRYCGQHDVCPTVPNIVALTTGEVSQGALAFSPTQAQRTRQKRRRFQHRGAIVPCACKHCWFEECA